MVAVEVVQAHIGNGSALLWVPLRSMAWLDGGGDRNQGQCAGATSGAAHQQDSADAAGLLRIGTGGARLVVTRWRCTEETRGGLLGGGCGWSALVDDALSRARPLSRDSGPCQAVE